MENRDGVQWNEKEGRGFIQSSSENDQFLDWNQSPVNLNELQNAN